MLCIIHVLGSLCSTTTCRPLLRGVESLRRRSRGSQRRTMQDPASELPRIPILGTWMNKPPGNAPAASGWHHGCCCQPVGEEPGWQGGRGSLCSLCYLLGTPFLDRHEVAPVFVGSGPSRLAWPTSSMVSIPTSSPFSVTGSALRPLCCRMGSASSKRSAWGGIVETSVLSSSRTL